jgi:hypothetical protein
MNCGPQPGFPFAHVRFRVLGKAPRTGTTGFSRSRFRGFG